MLWGEIGGDGKVLYWIDDMDGNKIVFNDFVGKHITVRDTGKRLCRVCGKETESIYDKGSCLTCFKTSPRCDICMVKPELCHFSKGTCRDEVFAKNRCFNDQYVYFSITNDLKVGYMSKGNKPQRWVDQGATKAIIFANLPDRKMAGDLECRISEFEKDKTNWSRMLKGESVEIDLKLVKRKWSEILKDEKWSKFITNDLQEMRLEFPVMRYPEKLSRIRLDKTPTFDGVLLGIRGQYLIFRDRVFGIRSHEGYVINLEVDKADYIDIAEQGSLF